MMSEAQRKKSTESAPPAPSRGNVVYAVAELEIAATLLIPARVGGKDDLLKKIADLKAIVCPMEPNHAAPGLHCIKADPEPFRAVVAGTKTFEVRKFDRAYQVGDQVTLMEHNRETGTYSGAWAKVEILHVVKPGNYGLGPDVGVFGFKLLETKEPEATP